MKHTGLTQPRPVRPRWLRRGALLLLLALGLAGCGGGGSDAPASPGAVQWDHSNWDQATWS